MQSEKVKYNENTLSYIFFISSVLSFLPSLLSSFTTAVINAVFITVAWCSSLSFANVFVSEVSILKCPCVGLKFSTSIITQGHLRVDNSKSIRKEAR